jgi:hypothetical protein
MILDSFGILPEDCTLENYPVVEDVKDDDDLL